VEEEERRGSMRLLQSEHLLETVPESLSLPDELVGLAAADS